MLRNILHQTARTTPWRVSPLKSSRPAIASFVRLNSSKRPETTVSKAPLAEAEKQKKEKTPEQLARRAYFERIDNLQRDWDAKVLSYEELLPITQQPTPKTFLIDVREPDEVIQGMIPSAVNVPLTVLGDSLHLAKSAFREKHGFEKPWRDDEIIFYCRSGMRSSTACDVAKRNGYTNIKNYKGSWLDWTKRQSENPQ